MPSRRKLPQKLTPVDWGLPPKFDRWRPGQWEAVMDYLYTDVPVICNAAPTGSGKTLRYVTYAHFTGLRTAIVTQSKGLQQQIMSDFGDHMAFVNIKGKSNYVCPSHGDCQKGHLAKCPNANTDKCEYSRTEQEALNSQFVLTNYKFWIMKHKYGQGLGAFGLLVLDEAHNAIDQVSDAVTIRLHHEHDLLDMLYMDAPSQTMSAGSWKRWAVGALARSQGVLETVKLSLSGAPVVSAAAFARYLRARNLMRKLTILVGIDPINWVVEKTRDKWVLDPIVPGVYADDLLYRGIAKRMLVSATMNLKTLEYLGIRDPKDPAHNRRTYAFFQSASTFDPANGPVYSIPTQKVDAKTPHMHQWIRRADQIIGARLDRKGLFHTVSFDRAEKVIMQSRNLPVLHANFKGDITVETVDEFKALPPPAVMVSPSIPEGYDFPYDQCEYQIIGKVPFPDSRPKVIQARQARDRDYGPYCAMQQLMQMAGRGWRAEDDTLETFIIDDHFRWFVRKFRRLATPDFIKRVKFISKLPKPFRKIRRRK